MRLIVGLGNPDKKYLDTRHNVGFIIVDALASTKDLNWQTKSDWQAMIAKDADTLYVKPLTYMNESGQAIRKILDYYQLLPDKNDSDLSQILTVIHDDLDIDLGKYKSAVNSSSAGHKGIESIIAQLNTKNFSRLKIGIATPDLAKYRKSILGNRAHKFVLNRFPASERKIIENLSEELKQKLFS